MRVKATHLGILALSLAAGALSGCDNSTATAKSPQSASATVSQVITTDAGKISGIVEQVNGDTVHIFKGIPYAAPPLGERRWKAPQPVEPWTGVRDATEYGDRCAQRESRMGETDAPPSEDCLYLNVVTAAESTADKLPVMVFFHGGGLTSGTGNSPLYNNTALSRKGVVTVTVNSRLGPLGYMAHPALTEESGKNASGNYGTMDLVASLEWVQKNIANFGGDPDNVLIFGESGGGTKTISLLSSPQAEGLFHKAIVQSGSASASPERTTTLEEAERKGQQIAAKLGVSEQDNTLDTLRATGWRELLEAASAEDVGFRANIVVDGYMLPQSVNALLKQGKQHDVPLMVGANAGERRELEQSVPRIAGLWAEHAESPVYVYNFSHISTGWRNEPCVAFHGLELPYVFGYVPEGLTVPTLLYLKQGGGCKSNDPGADELDTEVAENTMQLWTSFAKDGDPSVEGLVQWPAYTPENPQYLDIGQELQVKSGVENAYQAPPEG